MIDRVRRTLAQVGQGVLSVVGLRFTTEEPNFSAETLGDGVEIRHYPPRIAAETAVRDGEEAARSAGFRRLAGYIFGNNRANTEISMTAPEGGSAATGEMSPVAQRSRADGQQIAMTAPVAQSSGPDAAWVISFYLPAEWTMDTLPVPNDPAVQLVFVASETVAVRRFSGDRSAAAVASQTARLRDTLREYGFAAAGPPTAWFYDPPWTLPFRRRNEVAIPVTTQ